MDTQNDRKTTATTLDRIALPADDLPVQPVEQTQAVAKTEPAAQVREIDYFPAVVEWEGREVTRTQSAELAPYVEMSNNEITEVVRYVATKGGQVVAIGVYFTALGVVTIVKYVVVGVLVFAWELVKQLVKLSRDKNKLSMGDDNRPTTTGVNITTNIIGNSGTVNVQNNIHL